LAISSCRSYTALIDRVRATTRRCRAEVSELLERLAGRDGASRDLVADRARADHELADLLADLAGAAILLLDCVVS
jgi:hypothetical protein